MWFSKGKEMLGPGENAPAIHLQTMTGQPWTLSDELTRHPVLLVFFKISCPTCQFALPFLQRMAQTQTAKIVLISQDDAQGTAQFHARFGIDLFTLLDEPRKYPASNAFHITNVPSFFFIGQDGLILTASHGFVKAEMEQIGQKLGVAPFRAGDSVPILRPG